MARLVHLRKDFGHPWTQDKGWDLLEIKAESEQELTAAIAAAERKFWSVWIRDSTGQMTAALYKPSGAQAPWVDHGPEGPADGPR